VPEVSLSRANERDEIAALHRRGWAQGERQFDITKKQMLVSLDGRPPAA
jgi:hypothetical protein